MHKIDLPPYQQIALIFQGGGALGAYQAGVFEGMAAAHIEPNWVAGISIGAINAALVAGNPPAKRLERIREFWETICRPPSLPASLAGEAVNLMGAALHPFQEMFQQSLNGLFGSYAATMAVVEGQNGFFEPRPFAALSPGVGNPAQISFYDTSPLKATLERLVDFDRINHPDCIRLSLGATNVGSGNFVYFDNRHMRLGPEHIMASGALPPGFPAVEIDGQFYWDGGCVSNTPLLYIMTEGQNADTLVFQVDLWSARGKLPTNILEINERQKDIQFSSRTRAITDAVRNVHRMRELLLETLERIPPAVRKADPFFRRVEAQAMGSSFNVIQLVYQNKDQDHEGYYKDYEFSTESMARHWASGLADIRETLADPRCLALPPRGENFVTYDVHRKARFTAEMPDPDTEQTVMPTMPRYAFQSTRRQFHVFDPSVAPVPETAWRCTLGSHAAPVRKNTVVRAPAKPAPRTVKKAATRATKKSGK